MWYVLGLQEEEAQCLCCQYEYVCLVSMCMPGSICGLSVWSISDMSVWSTCGMSVWSICGMCLTYRRKRPSVCVVYMWYVFDLQEEEAQCLCGLYVVCA